MSDCTVTTNNHWHHFRDCYEVPPKVLLEDYDYLGYDDKELMHWIKTSNDPEVVALATAQLKKDNAEYADSRSWIKYRGAWYHLGEFVELDSPDAMPKGPWHGAYAMGFFVGILIEISRNGACYRIGLMTT